MYTLHFRIWILFISHLNVASAALGSQKERREEEKTNQRTSSRTQEENRYLRFVQLLQEWHYYIIYGKKRTHTCITNLKNITFPPPEGSKPLLCDLQQRILHKKQAVWPSEEQRSCQRTPLKCSSELHEQEQKGQEEEQITHLHQGGGTWKSLSQQGRKKQRKTNIKKPLKVDF